MVTSDDWLKHETLEAKSDTGAFEEARPANSSPEIRGLCELIEMFDF